jgi:hypothetical protein
MIAAGVAFGCLCLVPETYAPAILRARAAKLRKETGDSRYWSRYDEKAKLFDLLKLNLSRPFIMAVKEPICIFWNLYIGKSARLLASLDELLTRNAAVVYGILYLCFVAYPIVFSDERGWSSGLTGLGYVGIGVGGILTIAAEPFLRRLINSHKRDANGRLPPEAMISVVCIASILVPVGEMIFAWTCTPNVHWIAPILAGIPFGAGNTAVFIYASNYLVHSYGIYAASALAGNSVLRSFLGATLPLAGPTMYANLGPHWAGTLLSLLEFCLVPIPFVFYRYGGKIRMKSALISRMQEDKDRLESKKRTAEARAAKKGLQQEQQQQPLRVESENSEKSKEKGTEQV